MEAFVALSVHDGHVSIDADPWMRLLFNFINLLFLS